MGLIKQCIHITAERMTNEGWSNINPPSPPYTLTDVPTGDNFQLPDDLCEQTIGHICSPVGDEFYKIPREEADKLIQEGRSVPLAKNLITAPIISFITTTDLAGLIQILEPVKEDVRWKATLAYLLTFDQESPIRIIVWWT